MNKTVLSTAIATAIGTASFSANASLLSDTVLVFDSGFGNQCVTGGVYPDCINDSVLILNGSWFSTDNDANGSIASHERYRIFNSGGVESDVVSSSGETAGIAMHTITDNTGNPMNSHMGSINGSENPVGSIWSFFGGTGMDYLTSAMTDLGLDGNNDHMIDMSGWTWTWNGIAVMPLGGDPGNFGSDTGIGIMSCSTVSCSNSSTFVLEYDAHHTDSNLSGLAYHLHLEGTIGTAVVPVPAAVWLFGSGLLGLAGMARRKKKE